MRGISRLRAGWLLVALGLIALPGMVAAQPPADGPKHAADGKHRGVSDTGEQLPLTYDLAQPRPSKDPFGNSRTNALWMWSQGRRAYSLIPGAITNNDLLSRAIIPNPFRSQLAAFDLDSLKLVASRELNELVGGTESETTAQNDYGPLARLESGAVDEAGGRLFLVYQDPGVVDNKAAHDPTSTPCGLATSARPTCVGGVLVLDGESLDEIARVPVRQITIDDSPLVHPDLVQMSYAPPRVEGESGKVLLLLQDRAVHSPGGSVRPADFGVNAVYAVQVDPDQGMVDWAVRVDACRGDHHGRMSGDIATIRSEMARPSRAAIFRSPSMDDPAVWVGCYATGKSAVLARIPLDATGTPARLGLPAGPGAQEAFAGPRNVTDWVADPTSERIALRVVDGSPQAEAWWVFDGRQRAFIATIDLGPGYSAFGTTYGFDPSIGRLYMLAPDTRDHVPNGAPGGLFMVDLRRTPVPKASAFPDLAWLLPGHVNDVPIAIDPADVGAHRPRRLFVREGKVRPDGSSAPLRYRILADQVVMTGQPPHQLALE